jgi:hypothetical protein
MGFFSHLRGLWPSSRFLLDRCIHNLLADLERENRWYVDLVGAMTGLEIRLWRSTLSRKSPFLQGIKDQWTAESRAARIEEASMDWTDKTEKNSLEGHWNYIYLGCEHRH